MGMAKLGQNGEGSDIGEWMAQRQREVSGGPQAELAGRQAWADSTLTGRNLVAARPSDVRALGAQVQNLAAAARATNAAAIRRGDKAILTDTEIAAIVYNETRSLSGPGIDQARANIAHAVINADETYGPRRHRLAGTASAKASVPKVEQSIYEASAASVARARAERARGIDPTAGALHLNFRGDSSRSAFKYSGTRPKTQVGPLNNSWPSDDLPASGVYANTYDDD
jgi:hypothetical protein